MQVTEQVLNQFMENPEFVQDKYRCINSEYFRYPANYSGGHYYCVLRNLDSGRLFGIPYEYSNGNGILNFQNSLVPLQEGRVESVCYVPTGEEPEA